MAEALKFKMNGLTDSFTGNGSTDKFTLTNPVDKVTNVTINGVATTDYTVSGTDVTFTVAPTENSTIIITYIGWEGIPTVKGKDGKSAYQAAKEGGYAGNDELVFNQALANVANKQTTITTTGILKGEGAGKLTTAVAGTDYVHPNGTVANATNAASATKLANARSITIGSTTRTFDGTGNIAYTLADIGALAIGGTAASATKLANARAITIGNASKNFDGSANVAYTLTEIGGGTLGGAVVANASAVSNLNTKQVRNIIVSTNDIGVNAPLAAGDIYIVYEA